MIYCFDIDGTICDTKGTDYGFNCEVRPHMIECINRLHSEGHKIVFLTARGSLSGIDWRLLTEQQLAKWGFKYHELHFGKPDADFFVDDKAVNVKDFKEAL